MKEEYTVDGLLCHASLMDDFIRNIPNRNLDGAAYEQIRLCHYEDGILLVSEYHMNHYCYIYIGDNPNVQIIRGSYDSRRHGNPNPEPVNGKLHCVWECGKWKKEGPWVEKTKTLLSKLISRVKDFKEKVEQEKIEEENKKKALLELENAQLLKNWE